MKLKFSILSLSAAAILFSSCEPRDTKITKPDTRVGGSSAQGGQSDATADNKFLVNLTERQVEVIELFRALTDAQFNAGRFVKDRNEVNVEDVDLNGAKVKKVTSKLNVKTADWEVSQEAVLLVNLVLDENGHVQKIVARKSQEDVSSEKAKNLQTSTDISLRNLSKDITIENVGADSWDVVLDSFDEINLKVGKSSMNNTLKFNFTSSANDPHVFTIKNVKLTHNRTGALSGSFAMQSDNESTTLSVETKSGEKCASMTGVLQLQSFDLKKDKAPVYKRTLTYGLSEVVVANGSTTLPLPTAECENRLPVDLRKLLN